MVSRAPRRREIAETAQEVAGRRPTPCCRALACSVGLHARSVDRCHLVSPRRSARWPGRMRSQLRRPPLAVRRARDLRARSQALLQQGCEALGVGYGDGQLGVAQHLQRTPSADGSRECQQHAAIAVAGERQARIGDRQTRWACGLQQRVGAGDRDVGDVLQRRREPEWAVARAEPLVADLDPRVRRRDPEHARQRLVGRGERELEALDAAHVGDVRCRRKSCETRE